LPEKQDYYATLGVGRDATADDVKKSYRRLARKYHPDLNPGDKSSEDRFKKVQEAYDILSDPKKKQMFDQVGFYSESGMPGPGAGPQPGAGPGFGGFDFGDFMASQARAGGHSRPQQENPAGFRDIFSQFFGKGANPQAPVAERGSDLEYSLNADFWQSIKGTQVKLNIHRNVACQACNGTGSAGGASINCPQCAGSGEVSQMAGAMRFNLSCPRCGGSGKLKNACPSCHGDGHTSMTDSVEVRIPQGVQSGDRLRVGGKGNSGTGGAASGDLFITVRVEPHEFFHRDGDNIEIKLPISVSEAGLGAKIEVPTIDGRALLKIPQGTANGQRFRLREKGVFNARKNSRGDQIVEVSIQTPGIEDERVRELLRNLAELNPEDPRTEIWAKVDKNHG
jgi:molecular chaperone DnaJ